MTSSDDQGESCAKSTTYFYPSQVRSLEDSYRVRYEEVSSLLQSTLGFKIRNHREFLAKLQIAFMDLAKRLTHLYGL